MFDRILKHLRRNAGGGVGHTAPQANSTGCLERAMQAHRDGHLDAADSGYRDVLAANPSDVDAMHFLGVLAHQRGQLDEAERLIRSALALGGRNVAARINLGKVLHARGDPRGAAACFRAALDLAPDHVDALAHLGEALAALGEAQAAVETLNRAIRLRPERIDAHCELGNVLLSLGRTQEAAAAYEAALRVRPDLAAAHYNRAIALRELNRAEDAIEAFRAAIHAQPDLASAWYGLGHTYADGDRAEEARRCFERALELQPEFAEARWSLALSRIPSVPATHEDARTSRVEFASELAELERWFTGERADRGHAAVGAQQPFALAYQEENNRDLLSRYGALCSRLMEDSPLPRWTGARTVRSAARRLSVGIVSRHFRSHSVWTAILKGWVEQIDRDRIELHAYCLGVDDDHETHIAKGRLAGFDRGPRSLQNWVGAILSGRHDALIYPEIGMEPIALKLASLRLAPVQAATWGHPETTGLPTIDYFISAQMLEPADAQANYSERLVTLPHLGVYLEPGFEFPPASDPSQWSLEPGVPLLVCPGTPFKYAADHDGVYPAIARRLEACRFLFFEHWTPGLSARLRARLERAFARDGLEFERYVTFLPWQPRAAFHGLMRRAQVCLDTIGFSGFNTALQSLECGLPIVGFEGRFLRGRLASGILRRAELPELIAGTSDQFVDLVARRVQDTTFRTDVRARVLTGRDSLYRDSAPVRALEEFLERATRPEAS